MLSNAATQGTACKSNCIEVLSILAPCLPSLASSIASQWLSHGSESTLPPSLHWDLVSTMACAAAHAGNDACVALVNAVVEQLGSGEGLLAWDRKKANNERVLFIATQATHLAAALMCLPQREQVMSCLQNLAQLVRDCAAMCQSADTKLASEKYTSCRVRIALAEAVAVLFPSKVFADTLHSAIDIVSSIIRDDKYLARLAGAALVPKLLENFSNPTVSQETIQSHALHMYRYRYIHSISLCMFYSK